jgi:uncharacterized protein (TIGR02001 family)
MAMVSLALLPCLCASALRAQELEGSLGATSDNVFRGLTQSDGEPALLADAHLAATRWFAGVATQTIRRRPKYGAGFELVGYAGYQHPLGSDWAGTVVVRRYQYPGYPGRRQFNYDELSLSLDWRARVIASVIASPDTYAEAFPSYALPRFGTGTAFCYELAVRAPPLAGVSATAGLGYYDLQRLIAVRYAYWSAGLTRSWGPVSMDLRYVGSDGEARELFPDRAGNRLILSALLHF